LPGLTKSFLFIKEAVTRASHNDFLWIVTAEKGDRHEDKSELGLNRWLLLTQRMRKMRPRTAKNKQINKQKNEDERKL
jgi:hypothetical protein